MFRVYLLQNPNGHNYIGLSADVPRRLAQHNSGVSEWTRVRGPWKLRWQSGPLNLTDARRLENLLKRQKGGTGLYRLTGLPRPGS
jgi:putative endonuclease